MYTVIGIYCREVSPVTLSGHRHFKAEAGPSQENHLHRWPGIQEKWLVDTRYIRVEINEAVSVTF